MLELKLQAMLFGCIFLFLVGLRLVFVKTTDRRKYFEILIVTSAAVVFSYPVLNENGIFFSCLLYNHLYLPIYYIFGPALYLVSLCFLGKYEGISRKNLLLFLPAITIFVAEILAYIIYPSLFDQKPIDFFLTDRMHLFDWIVYAGFTFNAIFLTITGYMIL